MRKGKLSILVMCVFLVGILVVGVCESAMESFFKTINEEFGDQSWSGVTGFELTMNEEVNILALGRPVTVNFEQEHTITLWRTSDKANVAEVVVGPGSPRFEVDNGFYAYEMLGSPVTLPAGETYRLVSEEFAGGDNWPTVFTITPGEDTTDVASINGIPWRDAPIGFYPEDIDPRANYVDVGPTFIYGEPASVKSADKLCTTWAELKHGNL